MHTELIIIISFSLHGTGIVFSFLEKFLNKLGIQCDKNWDWEENNTVVGGSLSRG